MPETPFIHLRLHSEYSVTDGIVRLDDAVARAAACGMPALAPGNNAWRLIASPDAADGSTLIHQDARLLAARLASGALLDYALDPARLAYVHLVHGDLQLNGLTMRTGDGAKIAAESALRLIASEDSEVLLFDLPPGVLG